MPPRRKAPAKKTAAPVQEVAAKVAPPATSDKPPKPEPAPEPAPTVTVQTMRLWSGGPAVGSVDTVTRTEYLDGLIRRGYVRVVDGP